jgi:proline dehydrogenase
LEIERSKKLGFNLGIKLIRGAYMNEERRIAKENGYESPINESIEDTHKTYNTSLKLILENMLPNDRLLVGSHNSESVEIAKRIINERGIKDGRVKFGQLKGFSD